MEQIKKITQLGKMKKGQSGKIFSVHPGNSGDLLAKDKARRLMELGLIEGEKVEIVHEAPIWSDPLAVRVRGSMIALRRSEADFVQVVEEELA